MKTFHTDTVDVITHERKKKDFSNNVKVFHAQAARYLKQSPV